MSAIAGVVRSGKSNLVMKMLEKMSYRGPAGKYILKHDKATLGISYNQSQRSMVKILQEEKVACDGRGSTNSTRVQISDEGIEAWRDPLGIAPLYYGWTDNGILCFASEIKALLIATSDINELLPGHHLKISHLEPYFAIEQQTPVKQSAEEVIKELRNRLAQAVANRIRVGDTAAWLSGGLDSSAMVALAKPYIPQLHTFTAGLSGSSDLEYSRMVAQHIKSTHHEIKVNFDELLAVLPEVIYHLESFDALLVRSSMMNYLVAQKASDYASLVLSGEGGDELFAGYSYLKGLKPQVLSEELVEITNRLHNTALQRVDRCASAHGTQAILGFLDPGVVSYALKIPAEYKIYNGIDKWVLRRALEDLLPEPVIYRPKAKFWEGAGVWDLIAHHADEYVSDADFSNNRQITDQWALNSKEEMLYFQLFTDCFGKLEDYSWMGRTKGAPIDP